MTRKGGYTFHETKDCKHTPNQPRGYIEWHEWAQKMMETHKQERCPICGLWAIWTKKNPDREGA